VSPPKYPAQRLAENCADSALRGASQNYPCGVNDGAGVGRPREFVDLLPIIFRVGSHRLRLCNLAATPPRYFAPHARRTPRRLCTVVDAHKSLGKARSSLDRFERCLLRGRQRGTRQRGNSHIPVPETTNAHWVQLLRDIWIIHSETAFSRHRP